MADFKIGDWAYPIKNVGIGHQTCFKNKPYKIVHIRKRDKWFKVENNTDTFRPSKWRKAVLDNPLNRKLYPSRVEYNGLLLPPETAALLNEGESCKNM